MSIMYIDNVTYDIAEKSVLSIDHLQINKGDRIGVVGKNGSGKTTLIRLLSGDLKLQSGVIKSFGSRKLLPQIKKDHPFKSGGEVTQRYIDEALAEKPDILFADEPTANLDTDHIETLEQQFSRWPGSLVIVSHDRAFLDTVCHKIWEVKDTEVIVYKGNYSAYESQRDLAIATQEHAYQDYVKKKKQLEQALELKKRKAARATKKPLEKGDSEYKIGEDYFAKRGKKLEATVKAMESRIDKLDKVEKVKEEPPLKMSLPGADTLQKRIIIRITDVPGMVEKRKLWSKATLHINAGDKIGIIGHNGSGKTTFLKYLLDDVSGIQISPAVKIGYFSQNLDILDPHQSILENVKVTSPHAEALIRTVLARLHFFRDDVFKSVSVLSGGEQVKVAFAKIFLSNINTLILDEPTNFLDIQGVEALESLLKAFPGTVLFASHDRRLLDKVAKQLIVIDQQRLVLFNGSYKDYQTKNPDKEQDSTTEQRMIIENKITEVLGKLSLEPTPELEEAFQKLLEQKRKLKDRG
ncbi:ribosomal protection-like ABC-F family protein [Lentibacillus saliphilus]|uniref:ribosomal protection-like ABC-F family protein n=1 Tax=Lentibacillus saliphilus TaxID=2737028 RepID=UPI001C310C4B|nr:ABC-F family ATP-binding cassette domain-containing protein [Lentibacillus saliphilus]